MHTTHSYVAGTPIRDPARCFGRDAIVGALCSRLELRTATFTLLRGIRRIGKTTLLYQLQSKTIQNGRFVAVWVDLQLYAHRLRHSSGLPGVLTEACHQSLASVDVPTLVDDPIVSTDPETMARRLATVSHLARAPLVYLLDEIELLSYTAGAFDALQEIFRQLAATSAGVHFVGTTSHFFDNALPAAMSHRIGVIDSSDARSLLISQWPDVLPLPSIASERLLRAAGNHPFFVQLLAQCLIASMDRSGAAVMTHELLDEGLGMALGSPVLEDYWINFPNSSQKAAIALASTLTSPRQWMTIEDLATVTSPSITKRELGEAVRALCADSFLEQRDTSLRFNIDIMRIWIRRHQLNRAETRALDCHHGG